MNALARALYGPVYSNDDPRVDEAATVAREHAYNTLRDDNSEVCDAAGCLDWRELDKLLPAAFRTGDWTAYNAELSRQLEAELQRRAEA